MAKASAVADPPAPEAPEAPKAPVRTDCRTCIHYPNVTTTKQAESWRFQTFVWSKRPCELTEVRQYPGRKGWTSPKVPSVCGESAYQEK